MLNKYTLLMVLVLVIPHYGLVLFELMIIDEIVKQRAERRLICRRTMMR